MEGADTITRLEKATNDAMLKYPALYISSNTQLSLEVLWCTYIEN